MKYRNRYNILIDTINYEKVNGSLPDGRNTGQYSFYIQGNIETLKGRYYECLRDALKLAKERGCQMITLLV